VGRRQEQARRIELENGTEMSKVHWGRCTVGLGKKRVITNDQIGEESAPAGAGCRATANLGLRLLSTPTICCVDKHLSALPHSSREHTAHGFSDSLSLGKPIAHPEGPYARWPHPRLAKPTTTRRARRRCGCAKRSNSLDLLQQPLTSSAYLFIFVTLSHQH
jgi:hypothetical protein